MNTNNKRISSLTLIVVTALLAACSGEPGGGGAGEPPPMPPTTVSVAEVVVEDVTQWDEFVGRIEAIDRIEIRPRVAGYLDAVHFQEGAIIEAGALLFTIDAREYEAALATARADLQRARARKALADQELARSERLVNARAISQGELDTRRAESTQADADIAAALARVDQAALNVEFTQITAPISGRVGAALIKPGNLVSPGTTLLATVVSVDPVHVVFEGDERAYLRYQALARAGDRPSSRDSANPVEIGLADDTGFPYNGTMDFVDNSVNPATGTIIGRALLDNPNGVFTPGLFARVRLLGETLPNALMVHDQAILTDQDRKYVYLVGEGNTAQRRNVTLGAKVRGLRVIDDGLMPGDQVIVNGMRRIFFPGAPIAPQTVPMDEPNQASISMPIGGSGA